jgi:hypothetical protein
VITELEENTFSEITFDEILIKSAKNLKSINSNAFNSTNLVTKMFEVYNTPVINSPPNSDIFLSLSSMINVESIKMTKTQITEIPSYAFRTVIGIQSKLSRIVLDSNAIKTIGNFPFYDLTNLKILYLHFNPLEYISTNAFNFKNDSNQTLEIHFDQIKTLNGSSFAIDSFSNIKRPTELYIYNNPNLTFYGERIFLPFLASNPQNKLVVSDINPKIDCNDCRNYWIVKETKFLSRFKNLIHCSNNNNIINSTNFKNCNE